MGAWLAALIGAYVVLVLTVGWLASRHAGRSPDEYYLAGRRLGPVVLFMALFGTNATPFVLVGIPGLAYHDGVGIFGVNAPIVALGIPLTFWAIGSPARRMAQRLGALTPAELYSRRLGSPAVGLALFGAFALYTVPYMVQAVKGAGLSLSVASDGALPEWSASLGVTLVALLYTMAGGMRATAWTNVLQGLLFLLFMVVSFGLMASSLGGLEAATDAVAQTRPELLRVAEPSAYGAGHGRYFSPGMWTSWGLVISLSVIAFPHMFARLMAARSDRALRSIAQAYPLALVCLWLPAVMLGVWGAAAFPGLEGRDSDAIFSLMTTTHLPPWLAAMGQVALLAAVMSTLDAQILTLSSMLVRDVRGAGQAATKARATGVTDDLEDVGRSEVLLARLFAVVVALLVFVLTLTWGDSLFDIARFAFSGYVTLVPTLFLGVRWRRFTAAGAIASIIAGNAVLLVLTVWELPSLGVLPALPACLAGFAVAVGVSLAGRPDQAVVAALFDD